MTRILISPGKYIQGKGELSSIGKYVEHIGEKFLVLISPSGEKRFKDTIQSGFKADSLVFEHFNGECSQVEIDRILSILKENNCDGIIGVGGGKIHDTSKAVAYYGKKPVIIVPTISSTDAPCSALSVIYKENGEFESYLMLPHNPEMVIVDEEAVANAPARLLVAGMGDALATYFEARANKASSNPAMAGGLPTEAAMALAKLCYDNLIEEGYKAKIAAENKVVTKAVETIIETNTLLSGIGFESGGLAAAHAVHNGLTAIESTHSLYHGEKVAFGTLVQLFLENVSMDEIDEVVYFCKNVGLPTTLKELGIEEKDYPKLRNVAEIACADGDTMGNMPFPVTPDDVYAAILTADSYCK